ncbi:phage tail tape measure protein [Paenibacillus ferrarius]|uniref:Phage tail tape measure protein n=1 Tax=Paenibacillus ferrarius TaxID=1469647 RepID=A0A1V4HT84_9BACL|nr:phage tail tape measure protein [Paenibacillus ferrarius]OPH61713.1 phage tail tape measure protein [Paenibacillus ferrarius]
MAGDNNLRIIIQAALDVQKSSVTVNEQLRQLSSKISNLKVNVNVDQLKKSITDYEQWWATALSKEEKLREQVLQSEQKMRKALDDKSLKEREQSLQQEQRIRRQIEENARRDAEQTSKKQREMDLIHGRALQDNAKFDEQARKKSLGDLDTLSSKSNAISEKIKGMAIALPLYFAGHAAFSAIINTFSEGFRGMIDIEAKMAGYIQTNEKYFVSFSEGTHEMKLNTQKANEESEKFIQTTHALGAEIDNVLESARLWGRLYKDNLVVQEMVRQSTQLSTVDLVSLNDSTKMMEATIAQYGVQIRNVNDAQVQGTRILDSWSSVAHNTMAPAKDIGDAFERTGKIAYETGVSFDFMNGLISAGVRNTALGGANLGNMWKTVLGTIRTDKAVNELERLGVVTKELVNGSEQWRKAEDILLDLSIAVTDKNYDLTKSYQDISRGVYQFAKLAASLNAGDILLGVSASINSTGATMDYLKIQMDTIERKSKQVKASLLDVFTKAGDDGLRSSIKDVLDVIDRLLIGLTNVPKGVYEGTAAIGGLLLAYVALKTPITSLITAIGVLTGAKTLETTAIAANTTANNVNIISSNGATLSTVRRTVATEAGVVAQGALTVATRTATVAMSTQAAVMTVATAGIALLVGLLAVYVSNLGDAEIAERTLREEKERAIAKEEQKINQYQRQMEFLETLRSAHEKLTEALKNQNLTEEQKATISGQLKKVEQALNETVDDSGKQRIKTAGITKESVDIEIQAISDKRQEAMTSTLKVIQIDKDETQSKITQAKTRIAALQEEIKVQKAKADQEAESPTYKAAKKVESIQFGGLGAFEKWYHKNITPLNPFEKASNSPYKENDKLQAMQKESNDLQKKLEDSQTRLDELSAQSTQIILDPKSDPLAGASGKTKRDTKEYKDRKDSFDEKMKDFQHLVNMESDGYKDAKGQLTKLQEIRGQFEDLNAEDLYGIDENIYRAQQGIVNKAKGIGSGSETPSPFDDSQKYKIDIYKNSLRDLDTQLKESESVMTRYNETSKDYRDELTKQIGITQKKQEATKNEGVRLRADITSLESQIAKTSDQKQQNALLQQLDQAKTNLASLSSAWWDYEINIEQSQKKLKESLFNFSKDWISNEKSTMELMGKSEVEVAQMVYEAWKRVSDKRSEYTSEQQEEINKNLIQADSALKKTQMTHSDKWIQDETDRMTMAGKSEIEIAQMVLDARKRMADERWTQERGITALTTSEQLKADKEVFDARKKLDDLQQSNSKKLADNLKDVINKIKDASNDYYEGLKEAEDKRHELVKKNLDDELTKFEESISNIKKAMNRDDDTDTFNASLAKAQKEAQDLLTKKNKYELDDSLEGKSKLTELEKQYADKQDEIQKLQSDRTKKLRTDSLDDALETEKKKVDAAKKAEDDRYKVAKDSLDAQKKAAELYWQNIISDTSKFSKLQSDIIGGHFDEITGKMEGFKNNIAGISALIGDALTSGITDKLQNAINLVKAYSGNPSGDSSNNFAKTPNSGSSGNSGNQPTSGYYTPTSESEKNARDMMKKNSSLYDSADEATKKQLHQSNQGWGSSIGATYSNGTWYKNGLPLYHGGGEVGVQGTSQESWMSKFLNSDEMPSILKKSEVVLNDPIKFITQLGQNALSNIANMLGGKDASGNSSPTYNLSLNIASLNGNKQEVDYALNRLSKGMKQLGLQ